MANISFKKNRSLKGDETKMSHPIELTIKNLSIEFDKKSCFFPIEYTFQSGQITYVTGPSGSGKTTLLSILGLMQQPSGGTYTINGQNIGVLSKKEQTVLRRTIIGFLFQEYYLISELSPLENIILPLLLNQIDKKIAKEKAEEWLEKFQINLKKISNNVQEISGGEKQRLLLIRTLIKNPKIVLMDEPAVHLDQNNRQRYLKLIQDYIKNSNAIGICATHDQQLVDQSDHEIKLL